MQEVEIDGKKYRTGKLAAMTQFHLMRKLMPVFSGMGEGVAKRAMNGNAEMPTNFWATLAPIAGPISEMSTEDSEWCLKTCLTTVTMYNGRSWVPITTQTGQLMFEDMEMTTMLQLTLTVLQDNLGPFFPIPVVNGSGDADPPSASATPA